MIGIAQNYTPSLEMDFSLPPPPQTHTAYLDPRLLDFQGPLTIWTPPFIRHCRVGAVVKSLSSFFLANKFFEVRLNSTPIFGKNFMHD